MTANCRWKEDEKPMLTYMLTQSFSAIWFYFSDFTCFKNVPSGIVEYLDVYVNFIPSDLLLKKWWVLTILLTLFLFASELVILIVNVNVVVTFSTEIYYLVVNVNEHSPLFLIFC